MNPFLSAMMHGELPSHKKAVKVKSQLEKEMDQEVESYVDGLEFEEDPNHKTLQDTKARRIKMKHQMKEEMKMPELAQLMEEALKILYSEGQHYLPKEANDSLIANLLASKNGLENITFKEAAGSNLQDLARISQDTMKSIYEIAISKFKEESYLDCLALFSLLCVFNSGHPEFWLRLGIAAQKCEKIDMASRAYAAALELDPENIGVKLFAAHCFIKRQLYKEAKAEIAEAKKMMNGNKVDQVWLDFLPALESELKSK